MRTNRLGLGGGAAVRAVQEGFGLEDEGDPAAWLAEYTYGVRFDYQTDGPGYVGPLYLLQGAGSPETRPMAVTRGGRHSYLVLDAEDGYSEGSGGSRLGWRYRASACFGARSEYLIQRPAPF